MPTTSSPTPFPFPTSYATVSLGPPTLPLPEKLSAISAAGYTGIELGFPDLVAYASHQHATPITPTDYANLCATATTIRETCTTLSLQLALLQPFANFEGWGPGTPERENAFRRAAGWISVMRALGCGMLQVGSTDTPSITPTPETRTRIITDLRELADMLATHNLRLSYENWCWSSHAPNWADVWSIVQEIDRPNVGLCLDTFQTAGGEYGDPTTASGLIESRDNHPVSREDLETSFHTSLQTLTRTIPPEKIFILQISDAYRPSPPLSPQPDDNGLRPRARWSSSFRPPPYQGGYLPIGEVLEAVLKTGFRGWVSMEVFDGGPEGTRTGDGDWKDVEGYARRAMEGLRRLVESCEGV